MAEFLARLYHNDTCQNFFQYVFLLMVITLESYQHFHFLYTATLPAVWTWG